jgi:hypothetical protein
MIREKVPKGFRNGSEAVPTRFQRGSERVQQEGFRGFGDCIVIFQHKEVADGK